ncbi:MAG TPA: protein kinase [Polyangiaceae bacterium]|nr:protein kinase [Polyangiaceae bacterium]
MPKIIAGKYRLVDVLGRGGMGSVWRAEHLTLNSPVAVKLLEPGVAGDPLGLARFMREARAAAKLRSPHVVQILDHGVDEGVPYIVMELLEGEPLANRLAREGRLGLNETVQIVTHIARALSRAHAAGIIHRDLKPDNVFLTRDDDDQPLAKLLDFGIVKSLQGVLETRSEQSTGPGILVGTPYYASPEQAQGTFVLDHRSDIWSLGVIAFECLTGERPFRGESLGDVLLEICVQPMPVPSKRGPVPPGFDEWFAKVCARPRDQRFASAKAAAVALSMLCEAPAPEVREPPLAIPIHVDTPLGTTVREPRVDHARRSTWVGVACALVLTFAVLAYMTRMRIAAAGRSSPASESARVEEVPSRAASPQTSINAALAESPPSVAPGATPEPTGEPGVGSETLDAGVPTPPKGSAEAPPAPPRASVPRPPSRPRVQPSRRPAPSGWTTRERSPTGAPDYGI